MKKQFYHKQFFVLHVPIFDTDVGFAVNASTQEILRWLRRVSGKNFQHFSELELEDWTSGTINGRMIPFKGGFVILLKAEKNAFRKFVGLLSHEVAHVVQYLLRDRRIPLGESSEEVYAYLTEYIMRESLRKLY